MRTTSWTTWLQLLLSLSECPQLQSPLFVAAISRCRDVGSIFSEGACVGACVGVCVCGGMQRQVHRKLCFNSIKPSQKGLRRF